MNSRFSNEIDIHHQTLVDHLSDLRFRLIRIVLSVIIAGLVSYYFSESIFTVIRKPILPFLNNMGLIFTAPMDKFMAHVQISIFSGVIFSSPVWFYHIWKFIAPGLYKKERIYALSFIFSALLLFLSGILICYFAILPMSFEFLLGFGGSVDHPMITISEYLSFFMTLHLAFGLAFELPLILVVLGMLDIISQDFLRRNRRYAVVILSLFAAVATPSPDAMTMLLMLVPLILLYELAIIVVGIFEKNRKALPLD